MLEKVKDIICDYVDIDRDEITENSDLRNDFGLNSLDTINIAVALEEAFGVAISDRQMATLYTVGDVIKFISENK